MRVQVSLGVVASSEGEMTGYLFRNFELYDHLAL
jgi:hypothetical protein